MIPKALVWFRRDLRLEDNEALYACLEDGIQPVPIWLGIEDGTRIGQALQVALHYSLIDLKNQLETFGLPLILRQGDCLLNILSLLEECQAKRIYWNRRYSPEEVKNDMFIMHALKSKGYEVKSCASQLLIEPMFLKNQNAQPYRVFTPFFKALSGQNIPKPKPNPLTGRVFKPPKLPSLPQSEFKLLPSIPWYRDFFTITDFSRADVLHKLQILKEHKILDYGTHRDIPSIDGTSLMSWALRLGVIGAKEVWHSLAFEPQNLVFLRQLAWREFSAHLLFHFPESLNEPFNPRFKNWPYNHDNLLLKAWQRGKTGVPIVDAGMKQLWQTGYMHNRVRMICASYLTKNLNLHWAMGERWFYDTLIDADEANNIMGWQWVSGCGTDAAPYFRIFNPVLQSAKFDPEGAYILKWLPELKGLKGKFLHQPWLQDSIKYHKPLVCLEDSRKQALKIYKDL